MSRLAHTDLPVCLHHLSFHFSSVSSCAAFLSAPSYILILSCTIRSSGGVPARTCSACVATVRYALYIRIANFLGSSLPSSCISYAPELSSRPVFHIDATKPNSAVRPQSTYIWHQPAEFVEGFLRFRQCLHQMGCHAHVLESYHSPRYFILSSLFISTPPILDEGFLASFCWQV